MFNLPIRHHSQCKFSYSRRVIISHRHIYKSRSFALLDRLLSSPSEASIALFENRKSRRLARFSSQRRVSRSPSLSTVESALPEPSYALPRQLQTVSSPTVRTGNRFASLPDELDDWDHLGASVVYPLAASPPRQLSNVDKGSSPSDAVTPVKASPSPSPVVLDSDTDNTSISTGVFSSPPEATRQPLRSGNALVPFNYNFDTPAAHQRPSTRSVVSSQSSSLPSLPPLVTPDGMSAPPWCPV